MSSAKDLYGPPVASARKILTCFAMLWCATAMGDGKPFDGWRFFWSGAAGVKGYYFQGSIQPYIAPGAAKSRGKRVWAGWLNADGSSVKERFTFDCVEGNYWADSAKQAGADGKETTLEDDPGAAYRPQSFAYALAEIVCPR